MITVDTASTVRLLERFSKFLSIHSWKDVGRNTGDLESFSSDLVRTILTNSAVNVMKI